MKANISKEKDYARSSVAVTVPRGSLEELSRKRKQEHTARLSELDRLSQFIQQGEAMTTDERQRKMSIIYSRRKRVRQSQRVDNLTETCVTYRESNQHLRRENQRLESLLLGAQQLIQRVEASREEGAIHRANTSKSKEAQLPLALGHGNTLGSLTVPTSSFIFSHVQSSPNPDMQWATAYPRPTSLELALMQQPHGVDFHLSRCESNGTPSQLSYQQGFLDRFRQSTMDFNQSSSAVPQARSTISCDLGRLRDTLTVQFSQAPGPIQSTVNPASTSSQPTGQPPSRTIALLEQLRQLQN